LALTLSETLLLVWTEKGTRRITWAEPGASAGTRRRVNWWFLCLSVCLFVCVCVCDCAVTCASTECEISTSISRIYIVTSAATLSSVLVVLSFHDWLTHSLSHAVTPLGGVLLTSHALYAVIAWLV